MCRDGVRLARAGSQQRSPANTLTCWKSCLCALCGLGVGALFSVLPARATEICGPISEPTRIQVTGWRAGDVTEQRACMMAMRKQQLIPDVLTPHELTRTMRWYRMHSMLMIGDSTMQQKAVWLFNHGVPNACRSGPGVCVNNYQAAEENAITWCASPLRSRLTNRSDWDVVLWK